MIMKGKWYCAFENLQEEKLVDLTGFYYSIAGCSATIIAIIGGFIASKLISISSERENVTEKVKNIQEKLESEKKREKTLESQLIEDDALVFIDEHMEELMDDILFLSVYKIEEKQRLDAPILAEYWERADEILGDIEIISIE